MKDKDKLEVVRLIDKKDKLPFVDYARKMIPLLYKKSKDRALLEKLVDAIET